MRLQSQLRSLCAVCNARIVSTAEFCGQSRTIRDRISVFSLSLLSLISFLSLSFYLPPFWFFVFISLSVFLSFFLFPSSFLIASDVESGRRNESAIRAEETLRVPLAVSIKNNSCLFSVCNSSAYNWPRYNSCMNIRALRSSIKSRSFLDWCINTGHISCLWSTSACNKTFFTALHLLLIANIA